MHTNKHIMGNCSKKINRKIKNSHKRLKGKMLKNTKYKNGKLHTKTLNGKMRKKAKQ